jgi:4-amino-4-deoxy-L-arabinose transferase-like glycosyltransferase
VLDYLVANRGDATWLLAVPSANIAGPIQLATGVPVMAMGGFSGADPAPTLEQLQGYLRSGDLRFVMTGGFAGPGPGGARGSSDVSSAIAEWVAATCVPMDVGGGSAGSDPAGGGTPGTIHDCAGAG